MSSEDREDKLASQTADYVAAVARALVQAVPFAGSLLVELVGIIIPNQRMDRVARFARYLEDRIARLEQDSVRSQLVDPEFTDLMEEGLRQAARAVSSDRLAQIAEIIAGSLSMSDITHAESKHLLRLLGELNDVEIIRLGSHQYTSYKPTRRDVEYREKHEEVLAPARVSYVSPQKDKDTATLQQSYDQHLERLGLLSVRYAIDSRTKLPQFDPHTGVQKVRGYELTSLGGLLCQHIGIQPNP